MICDRIRILHVREFHGGRVGYGRERAGAKDAACNFQGIRGNPWCSSTRGGASCGASRGASKPPHGRRRRGAAVLSRLLWRTRPAAAEQSDRALRLPGRVAVDPPAVPVQLDGGEARHRGHEEQL
eukprot:CAMPEP_0182611594 /NCGR_PEP_ID=MMETSP1330-20130603/14689_1 /TAXON_ID=464278 /ORGANISM="Picochlorum sp., Strain RCC944" /LENGTH=124 /DNA_ID=CAMNT_0024831013 /DNA_START=101 /DNA_END=475 /DNA_ORIENTATION=-